MVTFLIIGFNYNFLLNKTFNILQMFLCKILYCLALLFVLVPFLYSLPYSHVHKRSSFFDIECKGVFNKSIFFRLDRVCEDCYALFRWVTFGSKQFCFFLKISVKFLKLFTNWFFIGFIYLVSLNCIHYASKFNDFDAII